MVQKSSRGTGLVQVIEKRPFGAFSRQNKKTVAAKTTTTTKSIEQ